MPKKRRGKTKTRELPPGGGGDKTRELESKYAVKHYSQDEAESLITKYNGFLDKFVDKYLDTFDTEDISIFYSKERLIRIALEYIYIVENHWNQ